MTARTGSGPPAPPAAEHVGRYRLLRVIGEGGMGVVHLGLTTDDRVAAVKVLRPHIAGDTDARARLAREVAALQRVRHARVAEIVDVDLTGPTPFVATRYIPGPPVELVVRQHGPLATPALATLMWGLGEAISVIHAAGLIHRDIKPSNVLLLDGEPVVIDFGIARALDDATLTATGMLIGTPGYLAPELLAGAPPDRSVDWWGWAAVSAFAATGRPPFGRGPSELSLDRIRRGDADLTGLPASLESLLRSALAPDPGHRPTPDELRAGLAGAVGAPAHGPTLRYPDQPPTVADVRAADEPAPEPQRGMYGVPATRRLEVPPTVVMPDRTPAGPIQSRPVSAAQPVTVRYPAPAMPGHGPTPARIVVPASAGAQPTSATSAPPPTSALPVVQRRGWVGLTAAWLVAVVLCALVAPVGVAWLGWLWLTTARASQWTLGQIVHRRWQAAGQGLTTADKVSLVLGYPLRWIGAGVLTGTYLLPWIVGVMLMVWARDVAPNTVTLPPRTIAFVSSVVLVLIAWWGPGTSASRHGTRLLTAAALRSSTGRWIWLGVAVVVAVSALAVLSQAGVSSAGWSPGWTVPPWLQGSLS